MNRIAQLASTHSDILDTQKKLSYGVQKSANNMIDERPKADEVVFEIRNATDESQFLVLSSLFEDDTNKTIFGSVREGLTACVPGAEATRVHALKNGLVYQAVDDDDDPITGKTLTVASKSSGILLDRVLRYIGMCPTRVTKARFKSVTLGGAADTGNFDNRITNLFFSPFAPPKEDFLSLAPLVQSGINFNANILDVDFIDQAFPFIMSNEHYTVLQINSGTVLTINMFIGAQDSPAQRHWRIMRKADDLIRENGIGK
jgi:hypothetical protein